MSRTIYGYVNGKAVYSHDEYIFEKRGSGEITNDSELIEYSRKVTNNWHNAGHCRTFATYHLSNYALDEPKASLTKKEYNRLKELQQIAINEIEAEKAKYNIYKYEGTPLTKDQVKLFLTKFVEDIKNRWGDNHYYSQCAETTKLEKLALYNRGEVIAVYAIDTVEPYGNGYGDYSVCLMSDGSIRKTKGE